MGAGALAGAAGAPGAVAAAPAGAPPCVAAGVSGAGAGTLAEGVFAIGAAAAWRAASRASSSAVGGSCSACNAAMLMTAGSSRSFT